MATKHRSFATKNAQKATPADRIKFDIGEETFTGVVAMSGTYVLNFVSEASDPEKQATAVIGFIHKAVIPEEHERLTAALNSETEVVDLPTLIEITEYLSECYAARPTEESSS